MFFRESFSGTGVSFQFAFGIGIAVEPMHSKCDADDRRDMTAAWEGNPTFAERVSVELKRAERYRIFISLLAIDLGDLRNYFEGELQNRIQPLIDAVRERVRVSDFLSMTSNGRLLLVFPETSRQGAETAAHRLVEFLKEQVATLAGRPYAGLLPIEMASFPDAAGTKTVRALVQELVDARVN